MELNGRLAFTVASTAAALGITQRTVYRWIEAGKIDARKIAGRWFIVSLELERLAREREAVATASQGITFKPLKR